MDFKDVLNLFFERSSAFQTLWSFYATIVLALIAFFGGIRTPKNRGFLAGVMTLVFVAFAYSNLEALIVVTHQRFAATTLLATPTQLSNVPNQAIVSAIVRTLNPASVTEVVIGHISGDIVTLAAIWMLALKKQRGSATH